MRTVSLGQLPEVVAADDVNSEGAVVLLNANGGADVVVVAPITKFQQIARSK